MAGMVGLGWLVAEMAGMEGAALGWMGLDE